MGPNGRRKIDRRKISLIDKIILLVLIAISFSASFFTIFIVVATWPLLSASILLVVFICVVLYVTAR